MLVYLDTNVVIYLVERPADLGGLAWARIAELRSGGHTLVVTHLVRMEARVGPMRQADGTSLAQFDAFFRGSEVKVLDVTASMFDRAAEIRAGHRFNTPDSIHLAAAIVAGCEVFLTNDTRLQGFEGLKVEVLG